MKKVLNKISPSHITYKLSFFVSIVVILAFTLLEIYNFLNLKKELTQQIHSEQYAQAKFIAKDIQEKIDKRKQFVDVLADIIPSKISQSAGSLINTLKNHLKLTNYFPQGFVVISPDGKGLITEYPIITGRKELIFSHLKWFKHTKDIRHVTISDPFISRATGEIMIIITKAIRNQHGEIMAILAAPIFLDQPGFMDYVFDKNHRAQGDILVISRTSEVFVASSIPTLLLTSTPKRGSNKLHDAMMNGFNGYDQSTDTYNEKMLIAAADINTPDWFVVVRTPIKSAYKNLNSRLKTAIFNGVIVSLITVLTITLALFLFFTPLRKAAKSVKKMVEDDQPLTHIKSYKNDEIGALITGFNSLIDMVNERNTNLEQANGILESLSQTDGLTGVANRRHFDQTLRHTWRVHIRHQQPLTLLLIDIDYFKKFNDTYGHIAGDDCLKLVAKTLQRVINRPTDFFARYGGEEFIIIIEGDIKEGVTIAEKARLAISQLQLAHSESDYNHITISLGIASVVPQLNSVPIELIQKADDALYKSKDNGRNCYECYKDSYLEGPSQINTED